MAIPKRIDKKYIVLSRRQLEQIKWDALTDLQVDGHLNRVNDALTHIHAARLDAGLKIEKKEKEILRQWNVLKIQGMKYLENDLLALRKEQALFNRLLVKAESAREYIVNTRAERAKVLA